MSNPIEIGKRVKITGLPNNVVYGKVTKYRRNDEWQVIEYKVKFEDPTYGKFAWYPVSQVKEA